MTYEDQACVSYTTCALPILLQSKESYSLYQISRHHYSSFPNHYNIDFLHKNAKISVSLKILIKTGILKISKL